MYPPGQGWKPRRRFTVSSAVRPLSLLGLFGSTLWLLSLLSPNSAIDQRLFEVVGDLDARFETSYQSASERDLADAIRYKPRCSPIASTRDAEP